VTDTRHYYDFNLSLPLVQLILELLGRKRNTPTRQADPATREWFSQTRNSANTTTEVVTVTFKLPLSVSEISTEILRMPCQLDVWYQDRSNNWRQVLDMGRTPLSTTVDRSDTISWYKYVTRCYPIVAKKVQFRLTRLPDPVLSEVPYPVGLRNTLIRRNVYDRTQAGAFEEYVDIMGNVVSRYVKDWDAGRATDDNYTTFWKSEPQPDPEAVVSLFLDVRDADGGPQVVDKVYLDPVYSGQMLNLYYSTDDTVTTRTVSPITIPAVVTENVDWRPGTGLTDVAPGNQDSGYFWNLNLGPQHSRPGWIGVEWKPGFGSASASLNVSPQLFYSSGGESGFGPELTYDPGARRFRLSFIDGTDIRSYTSPVLTGNWSSGDTIRVLAGWRYAPTPQVRLKVVTERGVVLTELTGSPTTLPTQVSFGGAGNVADFTGTLTNLVAKIEDWETGETAFLANPTVYCDPDPVVRDENGKLPSTSLDNAIYVAPFISRENGFGGSDPSHYDAKEWTPIWRDYVALKGFLHLPGPTSMKYLKLEFSNLSEEPYPIYESGIESRYKVFPVSVSQQSSVGSKVYSGTGGFLGLGTFISQNGVRSVNWLNPMSVMQAIGAVIGPSIPPVSVNTGTPYVSTSLPNNGAQLVENSRRIELASSYIYARDTIQPYVLAADEYNTLIRAEGLQAIQPYVDVPWNVIESANPGTITKVRSTGTVPIRGTDWWIYPGQQLKVPASVMRKITDTQTVTERKFTLERRVRFNTTQVHRYDLRTVKRDAAVGYFAAVREVQPYTASYIPGEDKPEFNFPIYDPTLWAFDPQVVRTSSVDANGQMTRDRNGDLVFGPIGVDLHGPGSVQKTLTTQSTFSKVRLDYQDSGLMRSNSMWARPEGSQYGDEELNAPLVTVIPSSLPVGTWSDATKSWSDTVAKWGSPFGVVSATLSDERRFMGSRVLSFTRDSDLATLGAGAEAGISLNQNINFVPGGLVRLGVAFFKPYANANRLRLRLQRVSDASVVFSETFTPKTGQWVDYTTEFMEIPETLSNGGFSIVDPTLASWTPGGAANWTQDNTVGRTGTGSAKFVKSGGTAQTLTTENMLFFANEPLSCTAWVKWSGVTSTGTAPVIGVKALYYADTTLVDTVDVTDQRITAPTGASTSWPGNTGGWVPVGGTITAPPEGATHVAFQVHVAATMTAGTVWVDDVTVNVPGAARQNYNLTLTVVGSSKDDLYVADLYSQIAPIRYYVRLGASGYLHEVTDLRYTKNTTIVTAPTPVNQLMLRTVLLSPKAWAFGLTATPTYLK
jgi:hypothetical protein